MVWNLLILITFKISSCFPNKVKWSKSHAITLSCATFKIRWFPRFSHVPLNPSWLYRDVWKTYREFVTCFADVTIRSPVISILLRWLWIQEWIMIILKRIICHMYIYDPGAGGKGVEPPRQKTRTRQVIRSFNNHDYTIVYHLFFSLYRQVSKYVLFFLAIWTPFCWFCFFLFLFEGKKNMTLNPYQLRCHTLFWRLNKFCVFIRSRLTF